MTTRIAAALLVAVVASTANALGADALPYSKGYLTTGNYVVGGIDFPPGGNVSGVQSGTISMAGVPANADVLAAFLYWETIAADPSQTSGVTFRGSPVTVVRRSAIPLTGQTAACWSSGTPLTLTMFRADVRRLLPVQKDANGKPTGKRIVNDADLLANGLPLHTVTLPEFGTGNQVPESAGASLVVIYRDPSEPLRKIVIYDGAYIQLPGATMSQTLRGFYRSASARSARLTHIAASGAKNPTDQLSFNGSLVATDAFPDPATAAADRAWANPTFDVSTLMPGIDAGNGYGESATTTVTHTRTSPYECLSWAAVVFSTAVQDADNDGLPDGLEDAVGGLTDPNGELIDLRAMGASSAHKDLFVEMNGMWASAGTAYGSAAAPINSTTAQVVDPAGHNHLPTPEVLKLVGDTFRNAPVSNPDGTTGIAAHFDVGDLAAYHQLGADYAPTDADPYLVPSALARGGELVHEVACDPSVDATCFFPAYPGTVGWKIGFQHYKDEPVGLQGEELTPAQQAACATGGDCRRRFDRAREGLFHYVLYAHTRGKPKTRFPCLDAAGKPTGFAAGGSCAVAPNPDFHVPSSASGVADLPGGHAMITLGLWDDFVGRPFVRASTTLHELGHNLGLWHGGAPPAWGNATVATRIEPNCKPNYLSSMSYLFQVHGLLDDAGRAHLDYSHDVNNAVDETLLSDGSLNIPLRYRAAWYAPIVPGTLAYSLGTPPAQRFCSGDLLPSPLPQDWTPMGRVDAASTSTAVDWRLDGALSSGFSQDVNFDGTLTGALPAGGAPLQGFDDWTNERLDQVGGGTNAGGLSSGVDDFVSGVDDFVSGVDDFVSGVDDFASGVDDFVSGVDDFVSGVDDFVSGVDDFVSGAELDADTARLLGRTPPTALTACVIGADCPSTSTPKHRVRLDWKAPNLGTVSQYRVYRVTGATVTAASTPLLVGTSSSTTFVDTEELPNGVQFTYFVRAVFDDGAVSGPSSLVTITAIDDAPVALADAYATTANTQLVVAASGVLANDSDDDTTPASIRLVPVVSTSHGTLTLTANGGFSYAPKPGFTGKDTFTYVANDGRWSRDPSIVMSPNSGVTTVTITVTKK